MKININISTSHNYKVFTGGQYIKAEKDVGVRNITPTLLWTCISTICRFITEYPSGNNFIFIRRPQSLNKIFL